MLLVFYVVTGFLDAIGLHVVSNFFLVPFWLLFVTLLTWMGVRFSGHATQVGETIDDGAQLLVDYASTIFAADEEIKEGQLAVFFLIHRKSYDREDDVEMFFEREHMIMFDDDEGIIHIPRPKNSRCSL
ncbi:unnamed protein product [Dibothriocephalus latus]|uniref:Uncharacterized protein n=1 Tax=Dibothriocephalus latus TaxID=60516 RepID=A0A3P6TUX7_DIBLA|nr:unnamed protein product [Dibothriocephalus latus]